MGISLFCGEMGRRNGEETVGRWDGRTEDRRNGDTESLRNNGTGHGRTERHTSGRTNGRRATVTDLQMDGKNLQTLNQNNEGWRDGAKDKRSDNGTEQHKIGRTLKRSAG